MQRAALLAPVISGAVEHIREVGCGPGAFHGRGNQGVTLSRGAAGGCSGGGAAIEEAVWFPLGPPLDMDATRA